ncbi:MAG: hypothetical protein QXL00_00130 [Conexivisphaerales archaeon]
MRAQKIYQQIRDELKDFNHKVSSAIAKHYGIRGFEYQRNEDESQT